MGLCMMLNWTDHGIVNDEDDGVPQHRRLGQLVGQESEDGTDGLTEPKHCHHGQHRVRSPAQDEGAGQEEDLGQQLESLRRRRL